MGRSAGWLAYGAAIAGEASLVISVEDITGKYRSQRGNHRSADRQDHHPPRHERRRSGQRIVATMRVREEAEGKEFGVIVMAEGLAEYLPHDAHRRRPPRRPRTHRRRQAQPQPAVRRPGRQGVHRADRQEAQVTGVQLGYECRCARPHAFDVMLGSQLGVGAIGPWSKSGSTA